jgi:Ca2+/Na+ antiporter
LSILLGRFIFVMKRSFQEREIIKKFRRRHIVDSIIFYIFVNMWRLSFSDHASFYEYNYLDLFSEIFLLYVFLFFSEPMKAIETYWMKVNIVFNNARSPTTLCTKPKTNLVTNTQTPSGDARPSIRWYCWACTS